MLERVKTHDLVIAEKEKAKLAAELVIANKEKAKREAELVLANKDKEKRAAELLLANEEKTERADELIIANEEKAKCETELLIANKEKAKRSAALIVANEEKAKREAELVIANEEKAKRAAELAIANEEKGKRAAELVIANADKAKRAAELVIANAEKAKFAAMLVIANIEKEHRADELIIADKEIILQNEEKLKLASELVIADVNRTKREAELVIANIERTKRIAKKIIAEAELSFPKEEKSKRAAKLVIADTEKAKRSAELVIANIKKAKRSAELVIANIEKAKRSAELVIANKELVYQKSEKSKRAAELVIARVSKAKRSAELVIANIEKAKRAAVDVVVNKELLLSNEKEKLIAELTTVNEALSHEVEKRIQSDEALKESNEKYSEIFKSSPYSITLSSLTEGRFIEVNDAFTMIFGFNREEAITNASIRLDIWVNIEDRNSVISTLLDGRFVSGKEFLFKKKNGEIMTGLFSARIININKEPFIISSIDDITERKQATILLQENERKSHSIMENSPDAIFLTNKQGKFIYTNKEVSAMLGYTSEEMKSKTIADISPSNKREEYFEFFKQILNEGKRFTEIELLKKDGNFISADINAVLLPDGTIYGSCRDITERQQIESELIKAKELTEENEKRFKDITLSTADWVWEVDEKGIYTYSSEVGTVFFGISQEEIIGKSPFDFMPPEEAERMAPIFSKLSANKLPIKDLENWNINSKGERILLLTNALPIVSKAGNFKGYRGIDREITQQKKITETLIKAKEKAEESDRLKSAFLTNMSHEIRTPMNGILGFAELLREPNLSSDDLQDFIQAIQISGERMLNTINSIVDISKIESGLIQIDTKETDINEKMEFTYKFFKPEADIKGLQLILKTGLPDKEAIIITDNEKVYGILTNLVRNAIKFTFEGSIEFGYEKKGDYLEFFVKDTGMGVPDNQKELIFERFRQGSESHNRGFEGSGLGLSITKSYVTMLGGKIRVESEEGAGSTFYFTLPYNTVAKKEIELINTVTKEHKETKLNSLKILIVEDDEISYSLLTRMLRNFNKTVLHAVTGVEAVEACRNNPDIDLVLMDIRMPKMDGNEATRQIRQFNKDVIIIAQTAYAFEGDSKKAIDAGCNDYISKPINRDLLISLILKYTNNQ